MNGAIGAVHVDAAPRAHQQAADQRGEHVGHQATDHQPDHHRQAQQGIRRPGACGCHLVDLGRQAQHQEVAGLGLQLAHRFPRADYQQGVAQAQLFFNQLFLDGQLVAPQPHHVEVVAGTERKFEDALADQLRAWRQRHFRHPQLLGLVDEVGRLEVQRLQLHGLAQAAQVVAVGEQVEQQDIPLLQHGARVGGDHPGGELVLAFDADHVGAMPGAQFQFAQGMADQRRVRADAQAAFATVEFVVQHQVEQGAAGFHSTILSHFAIEPVAGQQHVANAQYQHHQAERGETEKAEAALAVAHQLAVHDHVGWRGHQAEHAADQPGEAQRHHQPAGGEFQARGNAQHHGDEDRHHPGGTHHRAQAGHRHHQQHQQARLAVAGALAHPFADAVGDAGAYQAFADHEQCSDQYHVGVTETGQGLVHGKDAGERQDEDHQQRNHVHAWAVDDEQHDDDGQQAEDPEQLLVHGEGVFLHTRARKAMALVWQLDANASLTCCNVLPGETIAGGAAM